MESEELIDVLEAILFASAEPLTLAELKKVCERAWAELPAEERDRRVGLVREALHLLKKRWATLATQHAFALVEVADGYAFRSHAKYGAYLLATREERPARLSRAALETLAIVAYRQPVTKPEVDHIRGVDCGATIRLLLDRNLVRIVGKKEEPGRPMLYGTTREFLSFFNLAGLNQLPTLREFTELTDESQEELAELDGGATPTLADLSQSAKKLHLDEEPAVAELEQAVTALDSTENQTREAFASQGVELISADAEDDPQTKPPTPAS